MYKDTNQGPESARIRVLVDSVARRIAAGEVIDRPYSVIRELLDNSIDAESSEIRIEISQGGIESLTCTDNGTGILPDDLKLAIQPHATSKIKDFDDLYSLSTLGFRGEALSSIAACSRLEILSRHRTLGQAFRLNVHGGKIIEMKEDHGAPGTRVNVEDIFYSLPGRKKFLKTPGAEGNLCSTAFIEKALPFPDIEFRLFNNGKMKYFLQRGSLKDRICSAFPRLLNPSLVNSWESEINPYSFTIAGTSPSLYRRDRRYIHIYVNNRRINDYSLTQAVEYGYSEYLPGGCYPMAFIFINIPPDLVDFNIHPSKKEVRFRDSHGLHRALVGAVKSGLNGFTSGTSRIPDIGIEQNFSEPSFNRQNTANPSTSGSLYSGTSEYSRDRFYPDKRPSYGNRISPVEIKDELEIRPGSEGKNISSGGFESRETASSNTDIPFRYLGQVMNLFLIAEREDNVYLIDQHAAHERILFNKFSSDPGGKQELLVPYIFELDSAREKLLKENLERLESTGFHLEEAEPGRWQLISLPSRYSGMEDLICEFIRNPKGDYLQLEKELNHSASCRKAVKDGDVLDDLTAVNLIRETFLLPQPRCPHGRPVWFRLTREELYRLVGRKI